MPTEKKVLKEQLGRAARKWAQTEAAGDERAVDAFMEGAAWWNRNAQKQRKQYEKELEKAHTEAIGPVTLGIRIQITNTAMLMAHRDRLAAELDQEERLTRLMPGSMKQMKEDFDQRAIELKKVIAQVTDELTALGLNYNATPSKVLQEKKKGSQKDDPISEFMDATIG
ncbi:MAG: hypothetical protein IJ271_08470 [Bacteroidales bacterium]|nr:hypothetical protein [Bacteroidales bacterium]